ncbi:MAG TPA: glutaminyl-peptide cyclotransferase [Kiritimatiellia bacterium]|nr:glutaminyl-peptide cyclotransferase [Kiritimatiellia bacterium]HMP34150.1 glutaminyl-peptide cyclotransferase [Kiritimatiellia bacterium]
MLRLVLLLFVLASSTGCSLPSLRPVAGQVELVATFPHDPEAYTQGLHAEGGRLWESTGLYGQSTVRAVDLASGTVLRKHALPASVFGEGLTRLDDVLWVLTWREQTAYALDPGTFTVLATNRYDGEGWGLTSDGTHLIKSDGTSRLTWIDPATFRTTRTLPVTENGTPLQNLNELEWVRGAIYANIYLEDRIVRINPRNGQVTASFDLRGLRALLTGQHRAEVLNGIAWNEQSGTFYLTGKWWPRLFEVRLLAP